MDLTKYQIKSITQVDHYVCTLSDELKEIARTELNETDLKRDSSITAMRDWILENPRIIKTRLDSLFILRFLRQKKYDLEKAKDAFERWMVLFEMAKDDKDLVSANFDMVNNIHFRNIIRNKYCVFLKNTHQYDPDVNICKIISFDAKINGIVKEMVTLSILFQELVLDIEENQIRGTIIIEDCSDVSFRHAFLLSFNSLRKILHIYEKCFNKRIKEIHIINFPTTSFIVKFIKNIFLSFLSDKMNSRIYIHTSVQAMMECDELKHLEFPKEFGGNLNYDELCEDVLKMLEQKNELFMKYYDLKIDKSYYPPEILNLDLGTMDKSIEKLCRKFLKNKSQF